MYVFFGRAETMVVLLQHQFCFSDKEFLAEIFGNPPCTPGRCAAVPRIWLNIGEFKYSLTYPVR
jgi:hypothetical protein